MATIFLTILLILPLSMAHTYNSFGVSEYLQDKTELMMAFMIHRHGDRTPVANSIQYCPNKENVRILTQRYGFGQLTDRGKQRCFELGQFIRRRYDELISPRYNSSEIYIRSTDSTRAKMTILVALAAIYPPTKDNWSQDIPWTPVPYTTLPAIDDDMLPVVNCPVYMEYFMNRMKEPFPEITTKYKDLLEKVSGFIGRNVSLAPAQMYVVGDDLISQEHLGVPLDPELEALLPEIRKAADASIEAVLNHPDYNNLQGGVLLKEFFNEADKIIASKPAPRIRIYSAHDIDVFTFSIVTKIRPSIGVPKFNALYSLELRKVLSSGKYVVVPVYLPEPGMEVKYLHVDGCKGFCSLDKFRHLTKHLTLDFKKYRRLCNFTEEFANTVDSSGIN